MPGDSRGQEDDRIPKWAADHRAGLEELTAVARQHDRSPAQIAIAWVKDQPGVACPIVGVSRLEQLASAVQAFDCALTVEERARLAAAFDGEVKEVSQYYGPLRRSFELIAK